MSRRERIVALGESLLQLMEATRAAKRLIKRTKMEAQLEQAMTKAFRAQGAAYLKHFAALRGQFTEAIREGDLNRPFSLASAETLKLFTQPVNTAIGQAFQLAAHGLVADVAQSVGKVAKAGTSPVAFDLENPRAVAFLKDRAAERVSMVEDTTKETIRGIVTQGAKDGTSYDAIAKELTQRFEEFAVGKPQAHIDSRAHLIAITEVGEAYAEGNLQAGQQLEAAGLPMETSGLTVGADKVSAGCQDNASAGWIPLSDEFPSGHQRPLRFPGCRCDILMQRAKGKGATNTGGGKPAVMAVQSSTMPSGTPVSKAITITAGTKAKVREAAQRAQDIIDQVHGDGKLPKIPLKQVRSTKYNGAYSSQGATALGIEISSLGAHPELTSIHEIGHFLDHRAFDPGKMASKTNLALTGFRTATGNSAAYKELKALQGKLFASVTDSTGNSLGYKINHSHVNYLLSEEETWARAYAQFIAVKSQDPTLLAQLESLRSEASPYRWRQWPDNDFAPIADAIEALMEAQGWLIRNPK